MSTVGNHIINHQTILLTGEYALDGKKLYTRVIEGEMSFLVKRAPLEVLDNTLNYIGFNYNGALVGARFLLGEKSMCPIILNPLQSVCIFPIHSPDEGVTWINPDHIRQIIPYGSKTIVKLSNGQFIVVDLALTAFNHQIEAANQLKKMTNMNGNHRQMTILLDPKKRRKKKRKNDSDYNSDIIETEE